MDGQLSEQPLAELIREISAKSLGGRLRLEHERVKVVAYFDNGNFQHAASNVRSLRLREYLLKSNLITDVALRQFNDRVADSDLIKVLCAQKLLTPDAAEQVQARQVLDVLRLALLWTEGAWQFDSRSRFNEQSNLKIDASSLLLDAARRLPAGFAASRFRNPGEVITPLEAPLVHDNLLPAEVFILSRLDRPLVLRDLISIGGGSEEETLKIIYSLALAGLVKRENWRNSLRDPSPTPPPEPEKESKPVRDQSEVDLEEVESFLARVKNAQTHYEVLGVNWDEPAQSLKTVYYQLARRYHPDRFRRAHPALVPRLESAFARITQAYDTLRDDTLRANYNSKLAARRKVAQLADSAPKATSSASQEPIDESAAGPVVSKAERAAEQFKEGYAALELGERKTALSLFASAARAVPNEPRYRAYYGRMLAGDERTRRAAETELAAAIRLDPGNAEYRVMLAELYRDLGLKLRAKGEAERAVAADPNHQKARELLRELK